MSTIITSTDSIPVTDTLNFFSESNQDMSTLVHPVTDTLEVYLSIPASFPVTSLRKNEHLLSNLLFTIAFLAIFAFIRLRGKDLFYNLLNILIKRKKAEIILNEGISSNLICYILSLCLSFSILSIYITYLAWGDFISLYSLYLFGGFLLYHFFLLLLIRLLGWTFNARNTADEVIINLWTYNILTGLLVSPFVIAIFFVKSFAVLALLKMVIFSLILFMIVKIVRWIEILSVHRVLILYMILYLCALEIMPLLILYKFVV